MPGYRFNLGPESSGGRRDHVVGSGAVEHVMPVNRGNRLGVFRVPRPGWRARPCTGSLASAAERRARSRLHSRFSRKPANHSRRDRPYPQTLPAYRLSSPYARAPLRRRAASFALALAINLGLLLLLIELGVVAAPQPHSRTLTVDLMPESRSASADRDTRMRSSRTCERRPGAQAAADHHPVQADDRAAAPEYEPSRGSR